MRRVFLSYFEATRTILHDSLGKYPGFLGHRGMECRFQRLDRYTLGAMKGTYRRECRRCRFRCFRQRIHNMERSVLAGFARALFPWGHRKRHGILGPAIELR